MDPRWKTLCVLLMLCAELGCLVDSISLTPSIQPNPGIIGSSSVHTIRCDFSLSEGDDVAILKLFLQNGAGSRDLIAATSNEFPQWSGDDVPAQLKERGFLQGSKSNRSMSLVVNDTICSDKDKTYLCKLEYSSNNVFKEEEKTVTMQVEAAPQAPEMVVTPNSENVTEFSNMVFECSGNVGLPAGSFQWYKFVGSGSSKEVTDQAVQQAEQQAPDGCTFTRSSRLTLNMTKTKDNQRLVVRCRVDHPTQGNPDVSACTNPDTDFCRMSQEISVQYPVSVKAASDIMTGSEGETEDLACTPDGNPPPFLVEWQKEGENQTTQGETLRFTKLTLNDSGKYTCTAYNIISGTTRNDSYAITLTVLKTTTPPPTTAPVSTKQTTTTEGEPQPDKAGSGGDDDTTIIIIVVVLLVVVLIVAAVAIYVFMRRRNRKKQVEEPPEKPFNNPGINTVATRPDLVNHSNVPPLKSEDGLAYAELQFDNKPRSRRPLAIDDSHTDYSDVSMPQV